MLEFVEKLYGRSIWECEPYYIVKATLQLSTETTGNKNKPYDWKEVVVGAIQASWIWRRGKKKREVETNLHWRNNVFCEKLKKSEDGADGRTKYVEMEATKEVNVSNRGRVELKLLQTGGTSRSNWWRAVSSIVGCEFLHGDLHEEIYLNSGCGNRKISGLQTQEVNLWPTTVSRNMI